MTKADLQNFGGSRYGGGVSGDGKNPKLPWSISKVLAENFAEGEKIFGVLHRVRIRQRAFRDEKSVRTSEKMS